MMNVQAAETKRSVVIDLLRGIAVILIFFRHRDMIPILHRAGWIGVDLFFVLSGFLVSGLLFKEFKRNGKVRAVHFLIRRGFKIYPMFYLFLATSIGLKLAMGTPLTARNILSEAFFVQNYFGMLWVHTWSLAVEEHFYFFLAFVVVLLVKFGMMERLRSLNFLLLALIASIASFRIFHGVSVTDFSYLKEFFPTHLRADSLLFGVVLAANYHFQKERFITFFRKRASWLSIAACILLLMPFLVEPWSVWMYTIGFTVLYVGFGILLAVMVSMKNGQQWLERTFGIRIVYLVSRIGFYSYSIYLWHRMVEVVVHRIEVLMGHQGSILGSAAYLLLSVAFGVWSSKLIEQPMLRLRDKWFPRPVAMPVT